VDGFLGGAVLIVVIVGVDAFVIWELYFGLFFCLYFADFLSDDIIAFILVF
jgi:hypothetical protein